MKNCEMHCVFVILPDGTVSHELADLLSMLQHAVDSLSEEDWAEINELLTDTNPETKIASKTAALEKILTAAGIEYSLNEYDNTLSVQFGTTEFTFEFRDLPMGKWGEILSGDNEFNQTIALADWISTGNDLFMVMGHELIHAWMIGYHGDTIASVEEHFGEEGKNAYMEYLSYQWEFEMLNQLPDATQYRSDTIREQYKIYSLLWYVIENNPK